jgi:hypothetical protein
MPKSTASPGKPGSLGLPSSIRAAWIPLFTCLLSQPANAQVAPEGIKLVGNDAIGYAVQGNAVSLSYDGNTAIVGGPFDAFDFGASWIFARTDGVWDQQGNKLIGTGVIGTNAPLQGWSVAMSAGGNTAIVGGIEDRAEYGSAWIFIRSNGMWTQQAKLADMPYETGGAPGQGYSVALSASGDTALVGFSGSTDLCCGSGVFAYRRAGGVWTGPAELSGNAGEMLGPVVAVSADSSTAIMQVSMESGAVAAAVFVWNGATWSRQATLAPPAAYVIALALSGDGNTALLGVPGDNGGIGAAWIFSRSRWGVWSWQPVKLVGSGAIGRSGQGYSVAISGAGSVVIVGAPSDNAGAGAAWLFQRDGNTWNQVGNKLVGPGAVGNAWQGQSVAISGDGSTVMVGGPGDNSWAGAAWTYLTGVSSFSVPVLEPVRGQVVR